MHNCRLSLAGSVNMTLISHGCASCEWVVGRIHNHLECPARRSAEQRPAHRRDCRHAGLFRDAVLGTLLNTMTMLLGYESLYGVYWRYVLARSRSSASGDSFHCAESPPSLYATFMSVFWFYGKIRLTQGGGGGGGGYRPDRRQA